MSRVLALCALARGTVSRAFSVDEVIEASKEHSVETVFAELDVAGRVWCASGPGALAARTQLAPHAAARPALVVCSAGAELRLRVAVDVEPRQELLLWFDEPLLARLDMPFLTLRNILGKKNYCCHECGIEFEDPNPLKVHLFLSCTAYSPPALWRAVSTRLRATSAPTVPVSATTAVLAPARLEALAAEWGRAAGGHVCVYCGKLYSRKYGLKIHIRTHTGYKPLRCRHCARAFGDPSNLNKHVRLHRPSP